MRAKGFLAVWVFCLVGVVLAQQGVFSYSDAFDSKSVKASFVVKGRTPEVARANSLMIKAYMATVSAFIEDGDYQALEELNRLMLAWIQKQREKPSQRAPAQKNQDRQKM